MESLAQMHFRPASVRSGPMAVLVAATLWAGLLMGVSFVATPVKFLAPSLSLAVALDVDQVRHDAVAD